jgi:hypothetical protein
MNELMAECMHERTSSTLQNLFMMNTNLIHILCMLLLLGVCMLFNSV